MAVYGLAAVFLYIIPAIVFLLPTSLVSAEPRLGLGRRRLQLGVEASPSRWGSWPSWCQFAMTIFYYPTLLGFVASTLDVMQPRPRPAGCGQRSTSWSSPDRGLGLLTRYQGHCPDWPAVD